jgi:hypothetical protein
LREVRIANTSIPGITVRTNAANITFKTTERVMGILLGQLAWMPQKLPQASQSDA